jgi:hypothetical protein
MLNLPLNIEGFDFSIMDNPRPSDYEMGEIDCNICGCHTSYYLSIQDEAIPTYEQNIMCMNICKSCLDNFIQALNRRMLDDIKKRAEGKVVRREKGPREND